MPLYEYHCDHCGQDFEKMMRFDQSDEQPKCPTCSVSDTHKRISLFSSKGPVISFSGSGGSSCGTGSGGFT